MPHSIQRKLILASTSPYRRELLARLRLPFEVVPPEVDESAMDLETPGQLALRLSLKKAHNVAHRYPEALVIGSDQVADLNGQPLGKPGNHDRAVEQLRLMRGHTVVFHTAVSVVCKRIDYAQTDVALVSVVFRNLSDGEIERYLRAETPYDCAGSAKSEGLGISLLDAINNDDPSALVGLPLIRTARLLRIAGVQLP